MPTAPRDSKPPSASSSKPSSIKSHDQDGGKKSPAPGLTPPTGNAANGTSTPDPHLKPPEKTSVKDRLTRMFSSKDTPRLSPSTPPFGEPTGRPRASSATGTGTSTPLPRKESSSEKGGEKGAVKPADKPAAAKGTKPATSKELSQRFVLDPDVQGGHEHI